MPMLAVLAAIALADTVILERGAVLPGYGRYLAAEDTVLDGQEGDLVQGGASALLVGPGKPMIIQFLDLNRVLGRKKVKKATLELIYTKGTPNLKAARRILQPWTEGPITTVAGQLRADDLNARWAATYKYRRGGIDAIPWQQSGAKGDTDSEPIAGVTGTVMGDKLVISGLEAAVQIQLDRWYDNHGFAFDFDESADFLSSSASEARPRLILELEDAPEPGKGPDLSVTLISRSPEYERFDDRGTMTMADQDGVPIPLLDHIKNASAKKWPSENEALTYTAHVKNVGNAPAQAFEAQWLDKETSKSIVAGEKALAPGEEATFTFELPYQSSHTDHRVEPVGFRIFPKGPDVNRANDFLEIQQSALNLEICLTKSLVASLEKDGWAPEDWVQDQLRQWNDVTSRYSRYSLGPDGSKERVRAQVIRVVDDSASQPEVNLNYDGQILIKSASSFQRQLAEACGLIPLTTEGLQKGGTTGDGTVFPPSIDRFQGIMGGGDTRSDALLVSSLPFPYDTFFDIIVDPSRMEVGGALSATDVYALNQNLGRRRGYRGDYLYDVPGSVVLTLSDSGGKRIGNTDVSFYQLKQGSFEGTTPSFTLKTSAEGTLVLPKRETQAPTGFYTATGHSVNANPFGRIDPEDRNGAFLVRATVNGVTATGVLKLWQVLDAGARIRKPVAIMALRLNVPSVPLGTEDVAKGKPTKSSGQPVPAIVDGDTATSIEAPDWLEIDLGSDMAVAEVAVAASTDSNWAYDVQVYASGEKPETARLYAREGDLRWSKKCVAGPDGTIKYHNLPQRARYVRIVSKAPTAGVKITSVEVRTAK